MNTLFAETLKRLRTERGLSQSQLGKRMFVNNSTVTRWENGTRLPDAAMIARLAKVLDADVHTAYPDYSLDAWKTGASGFLVKPLTVEAIRRRLSALRYPIGGE